MDYGQCELCGQEVVCDRCGGRTHVSSNKIYPTKFTAILESKMNAEHNSENKKLNKRFIKAVWDVVLGR